MSIHKSLAIKASMIKHRSVLKREERLELMEKNGIWAKGDSIYGLPKSKVAKQIKKSKGKKKKDDEEKE